MHAKFPWGKDSAGRNLLLLSGGWGVEPPPSSWAPCTVPWKPGMAGLRVLPKLHPSGSRGSAQEADRLRAGVSVKRTVLRLREGSCGSRSEARADSGQEARRVRCPLEAFPIRHFGGFLEEPAQPGEIPAVVSSWVVQTAAPRWSHAGERCHDLAEVHLRNAGTTCAWLRFKG